MERGVNVFFLFQRERSTLDLNREWWNSQISIELSFLPQPYQNRYTNRLKGVWHYTLFQPSISRHIKELQNTRCLISIWKSVNLLIEHSSQSRHTHDYIWGDLLICKPYCLTILDWNLQKLKRYINLTFIKIWIKPWSRLRLLSFSAK